MICPLCGSDNTDYIVTKEGESKLMCFDCGHIFDESEGEDEEEEQYEREERELEEDSEEDSEGDGLMNDNDYMFPDEGL
jgi:uncharacterized Zn finger protein